jgi:cytochrome c oxidase assembly protein Cox11
MYVQVDGGRIIRVEFVGSVHSAMPWSFRPTQHAVKVHISISQAQRAHLEFLYILMSSLNMC